MSNRNTPDKTQRYVLPFGSTVSSYPDTSPFLDSTPLVNGNDSYVCPRAPRASDGSSYWGDYFGLTQYPDAEDAAWRNAATFTFSTRRSAGAGPVCAVEGDRLGLPMSVYAHYWASSAPP